MMRYVASVLTCLLMAGATEARADDPIPRFTMTTIGGNGTRAYGGDGKPATEASLEHPTAVAITSTGILYIADDPTNRLRKIDEKGIISTYVGTCKTERQKKIRKPHKMNINSAYGIATDHQDNLYVLTRGHARIYKITPDGDTTIIAGNG